MPVSFPTASPEETARLDIHAKYRAEYERKARGGRAMTGRETALVVLFGVSMFTMMGLSLIPAMPAVALVLPAIVTFGALIKADGVTKALARQASRAIDRDIENGTLVRRYRKDLFGGPEVATLRAKFAGLRRLSQAFAQKAMPAETQEHSAATPAPAAAPAPKAGL